MVFKNVPGGVEFRVKVVPGSTRTKIAGILGDALKVTVGAAPEKRKANKCLVELLSDKLNSRKGSVKIISGQTSVIKTVFVEGISAEDCRKSLL